MPQIFCVSVSAPVHIQRCHHYLTQRHQKSVICAFYSVKSVCSLSLSQRIKNALRLASLALSKMVFHWKMLLMHFTISLFNWKRFYSCDSFQSISYSNLVWRTSRRKTGWFLIGSSPVDQKTSAVIAINWKLPMKWVIRWMIQRPIDSRSRHVVTVKFV